MVSALSLQYYSEMAPLLGSLVCPSPPSCWVWHTYSVTVTVTKKIPRDRDRDRDRDTRYRIHPNPGEQRKCQRCQSPANTYARGLAPLGSGQCLCLGLAGRSSATCSAGARLFLVRASYGPGRAGGEITPPPPQTHGSPLHRESSLQGLSISFRITRQDVFFARAFQGC
jgi:hypothetical protein